MHVRTQHVWAGHSNAERKLSQSTQNDQSCCVFQVEEVSECISWKMCKESILRNRGKEKGSAHCPNWAAPGRSLVLVLLHSGSRSLFLWMIHQPEKHQVSASKQLQLISFFVIFVHMKLSSSLKYSEHIRSKVIFFAKVINSRESKEGMPSQALF